MANNVQTAEQPPFKAAANKDTLALQFVDQMRRWNGGLNHSRQSPRGRAGAKGGDGWRGRSRGSNGCLCRGVPPASTPLERQRLGQRSIASMFRLAPSACLAILLAVTVSRTIIDLHRTSSGLGAWRIKAPLPPAKCCSTKHPKAPSIPSIQRSALAALIITKNSVSCFLNPSEIVTPLVDA
jgi:hypothetical protein